MKKIILTVAAFCAVTTLHAQIDTKNPKAVAFWKAYMEKDSARSKALSVKFLEDYPFTVADSNVDKANAIEYTRLYNKVLSYPPAAINQNLATYINQLPYYTAVDFYYHKIELYDRYNVDPVDSMLVRSDMVIKRMSSYWNHKPAEVASLSAADWKKNYDEEYYKMIFVHMGMLKKSGRYAEALQYAEVADSFYNYKVADLNDTHVALLLKAGNPQRAHEILEAGVRNNQSTPEMLALLKKDYVTAHGNEQGYDQYLSGLKDKDAAVELEARVRKQLISKTLPAFTVYDVNGKKVSSKDWAGKTVVLDFWASWCLPCKAAFPGMKMAQERLAAQKDVAFYFVVVHEEKAGYKDVAKKFIKERDFPFHILFDGFADDKSSDEAANLLHVTAIPHKMVLDKDGQLRFSVTGYYGSPSELADEIVAMVNMVKK